ARVLLDTIKNDQGNLEPFIVVILLPDYFSEEKITVFDKSLNKLGNEYIRETSIDLKKTYDEFLSSYEIEQQLDDSSIQISEGYSSENALLDLKKGLKQFQHQKYKPAYYLIKKSMVKLQEQNNLPLLMETDYLLGTILAHKRQFDAAKKYFEDLESLASQLNHQKYYELSIFMQGFCCYHLDDYVGALNCFKKVQTTDMGFIPRFQFYAVYGRTLKNLNRLAEASKILKKAIKLTEDQNHIKEIAEKRADIFIELGIINLKLTYEVRCCGKKEKESKAIIMGSLEYLKKGTALWANLKKYGKIISTEQILGTLYENLEQHIKAVEHYENALRYADLSNNIVKKFEILNYIIQIYTKLKNHEKIIQELDRILHEMISVAFVDLHTIARFHKQLGISLKALGKEKDALSELLISLNTLKKLTHADNDILEVLKTIIEIYKAQNNSANVQYYVDQYQKYEEHIKSFLEKQKVQLLDVVEEFWIFTETQDELYAHIMETQTNSELIAGFLSAMKSFGSELKLEDIRSIKIGQNTFYYYKEEGLPIFIVGRTSNKYPLDWIHSAIKSIYTKFWERYKPQIKNQPESSSGFEDFIEMISAKSLEKTD
ncbi:MAG: hypothetical protein EU544_06285, partial [Promethearchaeota archaeon]